MGLWSPMVSAMTRTGRQLLKALVHGVFMAKWLFWRLRWVLLRASGMALVIKGPCPGVTEGSQGNWAGALLGAPRGVRLGLLLFVGIFVQVARAIQK